MLRKTKIICTIGRIPETKLTSTINEFVAAGMDVARINMAHYDVAEQGDRDYLEKLVKTIRDEAKRLRKTVAILGDIQGPKVRISGFFGFGSPEPDEVVLKSGDIFVLSESAINGKKGATIAHEGQFNFFKDIKAKPIPKKDDKGKHKPIEFWFGDGKVMLETSRKCIRENSAICTVQVPGALRKKKGVTPKNATITPGKYSLANYKKDQKDIRFLLLQKVDFLALSFVNSAQDVRNLQEFVRSVAVEEGWKDFEEELCGLDKFPIISKIETNDGVAHLEEILEDSYGILVARGDLALQTGIEKVGILQKDIIEKCVAVGKPVITATEMLLSMMEFKEPKRSEVSDVTNAVEDGSDALMLSEETADAKSKYPVDSIKMMAKIILATETKRAENRLDYRYELEKLHEKAIEDLRAKNSELQTKLDNHNITQDEFYREREKLKRMENTEHISCDVCKTAFELGCKAIIVLTDTGGTARMISRFGTDAPILAGVYNDRIARLLRITYGVEAFKIVHSSQGYPFEEFNGVLRQARSSELLRQGKCAPKKGDRVILVAGYPQGKPGTTTFLNIYEI